MNPRTKNLVVAGAAAVLIGVGSAAFFLPSPPPATSSTGTISPPGILGPSPSVAATAPVVPVEEVRQAVDSPIQSTGNRRSYAIGLHELRGLPPDASPGLPFELWVTWEPPITRRARLQRLIDDAILERLIPGTVPEAPVTALLSVPDRAVADLIYADRFGELNAVIPTAAG